MEPPLPYLEILNFKMQSTPKPKNNLIYNTSIQT